MRVLLWATCLTGCMGIVQEPPAPTFVERDLTLRVEAVDVLTLPSTSWALLGATTPEFALTTARGQLLAGTTKGLFRLGDDGGAVELSSVAVSGLVTPSGGDALVVQGSLFVLNGDVLRPSSLADSFPAPPRVLGREGEALWFATDTEVVRLRGGQLTRFQAASVHRRASWGGLTTWCGAEGVTLVRAAGDALEVQALTAEQPLVDAVPFERGVLGVADGGALLVRVELDGGAAWANVVLDVATDAGATGASLLGVDPETGAAWLQVGSVVSRLDGRRLASLEVGTGVARLDDDGALVVLSGGRLTRYGSSAPVRFSEVVAPLSAARCQSCHRAGGIALPTLDTLADWRAAIDPVLARVDPATSEGLRMPRGGEPLTPDEFTRLQAWKQEGFRP